MAKVYCNKCMFGYEGGCSKHLPKQEEPAVEPVQTVDKPSLLARIKRIFKK